ncbi:MAG TPA: GIY-YIG nuclease family protein, partial [Ferruginibacter sp.]|nr:GIY-YIG nuclease family protein [Ferruginibacter sp.]
MIYNIHQECYYVYLVHCSDGTYYTGLTDDLVRRIGEHEEGVYENCYTFTRRPVVLAYYESIPFLADAVRRETQI